MNIGFDLDGVAADFIGGLPLNKEILYEHVSKRHYIDSIEMKIQAFAREPSTYANLIPYPGVIDDLWTLSEYTDIYYVTSRPEIAREVTLKWLLKNRFPYHKHLVMSQDKGLSASLLGLCYYVDDMPKYAEQITDTYYTTVFIVDRPWNSDYVPKTDRIIKGTWDAIMCGILYWSMY